MFSGGNTFGTRPASLFTGQTATTTNTPSIADVEVVSPPDDTVQALKFNPNPATHGTLLCSGSWDGTVRIWSVADTGASEPRLQQSINAPDGTKLFIAGADRQIRVWDLASNQVAVIGQHDQPVSTCHWVNAPSYSCLMTGSWDRTLKFWDVRQPGPSSASIALPERVYCADVVYPMAVVGLANRHVKVYKLDGQPSEVKDMESPLKFQHRCISIFKDKNSSMPLGFAIGSIEGRVAIQYVEAANPKDNFTFKCHRSPELNNGFQDIYTVNDIAFHPQHGTLATVGSDGRYSFWDKDARTKLKTSDGLPIPITKCCIHPGGQVFAYAAGYDWSKGHQHYTPGSKIFLHAVSDDMKPRKK